MSQKKEQMSEEISLSELIEIIKKKYRFLKSKWKIIFVAGLIGGLIGFTYAYFQKKQYKAVLSFALEEKGNNMGSYAALAGQFGIDLGGGGNGGAFAGDNLVELLKTRLMTEKTLLKPIVIEGDTQLLLNRYIDYCHFKEQWADNPILQHLSYEIGMPRNQFTLEQDSVLDYIQERIRQNLLSVRRYEKKLNLVIVTCTSEDQLFAKYFTEELVATASSYYIEGKTKRGRANVANLEAKIDSVKSVLDERLYGVAESQDRNINVINAQKRVPLAQKQIDIQLLTTVYAELSKNLEMAKYTLSRDEPLVHIIDTPILPLRYEKTGKITSFIVFGFMSVLVVSMGLIVIEYYRLKRK